MKLKIVIPAALAGRPVAQGSMQFQFDPEEIEETHEFGWEYEPVINDAAPDPAPKGRRPRTISMTLVMLERALGMRPPPYAEAGFIKNSADVIRLHDKIKESEKRAEAQFDAAVAKTGFRRSISRDPSFAKKQRRLVEERAAVLRATGVIRLIHLFEQPTLDETTLQQVVDLNAERSVLSSPGTGVDLQLKWLMKMMRPLALFFDEPPRLQLIWKRGDLFVCVLSSMRITHKMMHPVTKATLHAEVKITLTEARPIFRPGFAGAKETLGLAEAED